MGILETLECLQKREELEREKWLIHCKIEGMDACEWLKWVKMAVFILAVVYGVFWGLRSSWQPGFWNQVGYILNLALCVAVSVALIFLPGRLLIWIGSKVGRKIYRASSQCMKRTEAYWAQIDSCDEKIAKLDARLEKSEVPRDYRTTNAVYFIYKALENKRADNLKEAINLYETHRHQQKMLQQNEEMQYEIAATRRAAQQAQVEARRAQYEARRAGNEASSIKWWLW